MKLKQRKNEKGFALLLAIIISSVVLAIGVSILKVSVNQINLSATARESEFAFQAAHGGVDCMTYWRSQKRAEYTNTVASTPNPTVACFGGSPITSTKRRVTTTAGAGSVDQFSNTFQWGSPLRCTTVEMYVITASERNMDVPFSNTAIGTNGTKTCNNGNVCTVLVSSGYNRSCSEINSSIFSVQRELTVEF